MSTVSAASTAWHTSLSRLPPNDPGAPAAGSSTVDHDDNLDVVDLEAENPYAAMLQRAIMMSTPFDPIPNGQLRASTRSPSLADESEYEYEASISSSNALDDSGSASHGSQETIARTQVSGTTRMNGWMGARNIPGDASRAIRSPSVLSHSPSNSSILQGYGRTISPAASRSASTNRHPTSASDSERSTAYSSTQQTHSRSGVRVPSLTSNDTSAALLHPAQQGPQAEDQQGQHGGEAGQSSLFRPEAQAPPQHDVSGWEESYAFVTRKQQLQRGAGGAVRSRRPASPSNDSDAGSSSYASTESGSASGLAEDAKNGLFLNKSAKERYLMSGKTGDAELDALVKDINRLDLRRPAGAVKERPTGAWSYREGLTGPGTSVRPASGTVVPSPELQQPSREYVEIARRASTGMHPTAALLGQHGEHAKPKLIVLDLNNTLLARKRATKTGARNAVMRPYLSSFLEYLCGAQEVDGQLCRRFNVMIWSSAQPENVQTMVESMSLIPPSGGPQASLLVDVWARDSMDLPEAAYNSKFPTIKDLEKVWKLLTWRPPASSAAPSTTDGLNNSDPIAASPYPSPSSSPSPSPAARRKEIWSQYDTILIDDSAGKACLQPYNHLHIPSWRPFTPEALASADWRARDPVGATTGAGAGRYRREKLGDEDEALLQIVGALEQLRFQSNVSSALRSGRFSGIGNTDVGEDWVRQGRYVLQKYGIEPCKSFDRGWADRVLQAKDPRHAAAMASIYGAPAPAHRSSTVGWY